MASLGNCGKSPLFLRGEHREIEGRLTKIPGHKFALHCMAMGIAIGQGLQNSFASAMLRMSARAISVRWNTMRVQCMFLQMYIPPRGIAEALFQQNT